MVQVDLGKNGVLKGVIVDDEPEEACPPMGGKGRAMYYFMPCDNYRKPRAGSEGKKIDDFVEQIMAEWRKSVESIIEVGHLLIDAKGILKHEGKGGFLQMIDKRLPFGARTAQYLMKIADHRILRDTKHASCLPASWMTLAVLTNVPNDELLRLIENKTVHPGILRKEVEGLLCFSTKDLPGALTYMIELMDKLSPDKVVLYAENDRRWDNDLLTKMGKLPAFIEAVRAGLAQGRQVTSATLEPKRKLTNKPKPKPKPKKTNASDPVPGDQVQDEAA